MPIRSVYLTLLAVLGTAALGLPACAQPANEAARLQRAADTLHAMGVTTDISGFENSWRAGVVSQTRGRHISDDKIDAVLQILRPVVKAQMEQMFAVRQHSLAEHFSDNELDQIRGFYVSEPGRRLVEEQKLVAPTLAASQKASNRILLSKTLAAIMAMSDDSSATSPAQPEAKK